VTAHQHTSARRPQTRGNPHGKRSSWVLVSAVVLAFAAGGVALALHLWWLFWACAGVVVLAVPVGKMIGIMDDTVAWETTTALAESTTEQPRHAPGSQPGGEHRVEWPGPD
jgi:hypothetical protein